MATVTMPGSKYYNTKKAMHYATKNVDVILSQ